MNKLSKNINTEFMPSYVGGIPIYMCGGKIKYGFGSWLKDNAGTMGSVLGTAANFIPGVGPVLGQAISTAGNAIEQNYDQKQLTIQKQQELNNKQTLNSLPVQQQYSYARGGLLESYSVGGDITDRTTSFDTGGLHSENPNGGIKVGQNALTEEGEFMFTTKKGQKYIFTNRF